jgi:3-oxoacyl-[acyl-carrier-protein] synthase-3
MPAKRARILSVGTAVPDNIVTNKDLEKILQTTDEWISSRTGIRERRISKPSDNATAYELGAKAAAVALSRANVSPQDVDAVICATFTPDNFFPSTACLMANKLGCTKSFAFDISAACAGFVYGLTMANSFILSGQCKTILLVGAEIISKTLDWTDRTTAILFGDGAGAVVIRVEEDSDTGILSAFLQSDGSQGEILRLPAWGDVRTMSMKGAEVFKNAVRMMSDVTSQALINAGLAKSDINLLIPHQANIRIIQAISEHMEIPMDRVITNLQKYGNTSSASIPLALEEAWQSDRITPGTVVAFTALGGGLAAGSAIVRF